MFGMIKRSISGGSEDKEKQQKCAVALDSQSTNNSKRALSDDKSLEAPGKKKKKIIRMNAVTTNVDTTGSDSEDSTSSSSDTDGEEDPNNTLGDKGVNKEDAELSDKEERYKDMPEDTPEWGKWILRVMRTDFQTLSLQVKTAQAASTGAKKSVKDLSQKVEQLEQSNKKLYDENLILQEKLSDLEFRQRRNNLIFDGITYNAGDSDDVSFTRLQRVLFKIFGKNIERKQIERCHWMNSKAVYNKKVVICCFNWFGDVQKIQKKQETIAKRSLCK